MDFNRTYDLAVAWNWEYDVDFVSLIKEIAGRYNISILEICSKNVKEIFDLLKNKEISFRYIIDRASDEDVTFQPLAHYIQEQFRSGNGSLMQPINPLDLQINAADKATMHLEFLSHKIEVPYTIIISPYNYKNEIELSISELAKLGRPFIIKPANTTGGGIGVVMGAETLKEIIDARQFHKNDKYLLQETIKPIEIGGRRAWFRVFYAFGKIIPCWWDDLTHIYSEMTEDNVHTSNLSLLESTTEQIHSICMLDFFSTELVFTGDRRCVAVDYVNEMCDMRLQSYYPDGVPNVIVKLIIEQMIKFIRKA